MSPIKKAVKIIGGQTALAKILGVKPQAVQQWVASGKVPAGRVLKIEEATKGKVSRSSLRPDIYPKDSKQLAA